MAGRPNNLAAIERRRGFVAGLVLRGLQRVDMLDLLRQVEPPLRGVSLSTLKRDISRLRLEYRDEITAMTAEDIAGDQYGRFLHEWREWNRVYLAAGPKKTDKDESRAGLLSIKIQALRGMRDARVSLVTTMQRLGIIRDVGGGEERVLQAALEQLGNAALDRIISGNEAELHALANRAGLTKLLNASAIEAVEVEA